MPLIVFRTDASIEIGNGHVARCLTLANELRQLGSRCVFVCAAHAGEPTRMIQANGFAAVKLGAAATACDGVHSSEMGVESLWSDHDQEYDARQTIEATSKELRGPITWIVADHYGLGIKWERLVTPHCAAILVVDDLANRQHQCTALLDQNYYTGLERRYDGLVPRGCQLFLGPRYALLRPEFRTANSAIRERDGTVRRILISFGSNDPSGETIKALHALHTLNLREVAIDVVVGASNPRRDEVKKLCATVPGCRYHEQIDYMARLVMQADIALGAGGATTWERCALGLPSLTIAIAENQLQTTLDTAAAGAIIFLGRAPDLSVEDIAAAVDAAMANPERNRELSHNAIRLVPASDGAVRVAQSLSVSHHAELSDNG